MKSFIFLSALFITSSSFAAGFTDEAEFPTWAEQAIELVEEEGIMTGYGDGRFGPDESLTRAEAVTLITRIKIDIKDNYNGVPRFPDVIQGAWYDRAIGVAANNGWVKGHDDGYFYPGKPLTRAEFAAMMQRAFDLETSKIGLALKFNDINENQWFTEPISTMLDNGLARNFMSVNYQPGKEVSRAEAAWTFAQLIKKPGLTGKSGAFDTTGYDPLNSGRVAIKPRDFNANDQGYDVERAAINVTADPASEAVVVFDLGSDWQPLGVIRISNSFDYRADFESLRVRLRLDASDMGPEEGFFLKFEGPGLLIEKKVYSNGELALTGLDYRLESNENLMLKVSIKANTEESFYSRTATGKVFVMEVSGEAFKEFVSQSRDRDVRVAPIEYGDRDLSKFEFTPVASE